MRRALAFFLCLASCGPSQTQVRPDDHGRHDDVTPPDAHHDDAHGPPSRELAASATYDDVVALARALDSASAEQSTRGCVLSTTRLEADVGVPVRPLPSPWDDASALLAPRAGAVRVLSRWGTTPGDSALAVAAFTTLPPPVDDAPIVVLFVTSRGVWARSSVPSDAPSAAPVAIDAVPQDVPLLTHPPAAIVVVADATTSVATLRQLLARLDGTQLPIALGVPFPIDTHLPPAPGQASPVCPNGLPATPPGPEGDLDPAAAVATLGSLHDALATCAAQAPHDGTLDVMFRLDASGAVVDACVKRDDVGRDAVRACVVSALRGLHFAAPRPAGFVDLDVPLRLSANRSDVTQRAVCAE